MADWPTFSRECQSCMARVTVVLKTSDPRDQVPWPLLCRACDAWWRERLGMSGETT